MTFSETFGMVAGQQQTLFSQGTVEFTGNTTDLAIVGNSFFIVDDGNNTYYSRAGAFSIDANGKLTNPDGFIVQGWMEEGASVTNMGNTAQLQDIQIDPNLIVPAKATENLWFSGNLNAGLENIAEVWTAASTLGTKATLEGSQMQFPLQVTAGTNDQFVIEMDAHQSFRSELTLAEGQYDDIDSIVAELNNQIGADDNLAGLVEVINSNGILKFKALDGGNDTVLRLESGTNDVLADLGFTDGVSATSGLTALATSELNDLVSGNLFDGDTIEINGTAADGTVLSGTFTFGAGNDGTTIEALIDKINQVYAGNATATFENGKITVTDDQTGKSQSTIDLSVVSQNGSFSVPNFLNTSEGSNAKVSSSFVIYDSLGAAHNMTMEYTKSERANEWLWVITGSGDDVIREGGSGKVQFSSGGKLLSFEYDNGADELTIEPGNNATPFAVKLHGEYGDGFSGLSQYDSVSTLFAREQDGLKTGTFHNLRILNDGSIIGSFSNGEEKRIGQIATAKFDNPDALEVVGGNNLTNTNESGEPIIGEADRQNTLIQSGSLELSTVDMADQFIQMIEAQRAYQAGARILSTYDEILQQTTQLGR